MENKQLHQNAWKEWIKKKLPPSCARLLKTILIKFLLITKKDLNYFYNEDFATTPLRNKAWAEDFCGVILKTFNPKSVIDFGCATGDLLYPFEKKGVEILGIDGSRANYNHCKINKDNFFLFDIRNTYKSKKKYDLCFCLEVAEHIEEKYSDVLINNLIQSSSRIVFSAEPTGQEGVNHINLKPYAWWIKKFEAANFKLDKSLTEYLKQEMTKIPGIYAWYIKNLLIFRLPE
jgi:2-polyprenyl-3-methyl-5-hydroxy-6-metoxy-1,4-benzoquinol methylase